MSAVLFPVLVGSIAGAVAGAATVLLLGWFGPSVAFTSVRRLLRRMMGVP